MRDFQKINIFLFCLLLLSPFYIIAEPHLKNTQQIKKTFRLVDGKVYPENPQQIKESFRLIEGKANPKNSQQTKENLHLIEGKAGPKITQQTAHSKTPQQTTQPKNPQQTIHPIPSQPTVLPKNSQAIKENLYSLESRSGFKVKKDLVEKGHPDITTDEKGNTPLHSASLLMDIEKLEQLLSSRDGDINAINQEGKTALHLAVLTGNFKIVKTLVDNHANPNIQDNSGYTALHKINSHGKTDVLEALLTSKNLNRDITEKNGWTALHIAVDRGHKDVLKLLLEKGADPNIRDKNGETILHRAKAYEDMEMLKIILSFDNVDINILNKDGDTVLHKALKSGDKATIKLLIKKGADIAVRESLFLTESGNIKPEKAIELLDEIRSKNKRDKNLSIKIDKQIRLIEESFEKDRSTHCKSSFSK